MTYGWCYDSTGTHCSGRAQPGARAVAQWSKPRWSLPLTGIYNCRPSAGGGGLSTHGEGRGIDLHVHVRDSEAPPTPAEKAVGDEMFAFWIEHAYELGVQRVIWLDLTWNSLTRQIGHYGGPFHGSHNHVELCWASARTLTIEDLDRVAQPAPTPVPEPEEDDGMCLYEVTAGPEQGTVWLVAGNRRRAQTQASARHLIDGGIPYRMVDDEAWAQIAAVTAA